MITPTKSKIMVCGMQEATLMSQDWDDTSYERWGLAHHKLRWHYYDRLFESHSPEIIQKHFPPHMDRMRSYVKHGIPVYSPWEWPEDMGIITIPHSTFSHRMYWESSISFPMALAMMAKPSEIAIYGVDMVSTTLEGNGLNERTNQKHSMMYQIGLAEGAGINVKVAPNSTLFDSQWTGGIYGNPMSLDDIQYQLG